MKTVAGNLSDQRLRKSIIRILRDSELCSMATLDPRNRPHINTAYFCYRGLGDLEIFFLSDIKSRHCRNLSRNPSMAMTIFRTNQSWDAPGRGLQLFGTCSQTEGKLARKAERVYAKRFPSYARWMSSRKKGEKKAGRTVEILQVLQVSITATESIGRSRVWRSSIRHGDHQAKKSCVKDPISLF